MGNMRLDVQNKSRAEMATLFLSRANKSRKQRLYFLVAQKISNNKQTVNQIRIIYISRLAR